MRRRSAARKQVSGVDNGAAWWPGAGTAPAKTGPIPPAETSGKGLRVQTRLCKADLRGLRMSHNPTPSLELAVAISLGSTGLNITLWKAEG